MTSARTRFWDSFDRLAPVALYYPVHYRRACRWNAFLFDVMRVLMAPDRHTIDVGAHRGVFSWFYARHSAGVTAFEAHPGNYRYLRRLAGRGVTPHHLALSDAEGSISLHVATEGGRELSESGSIAGDPDGGDADVDKVYEVACRPLDSFDFPDTGFLTIDVEGAEPAVVADARETIRRHRPNLMIEIQANMIGEDAMRDLIDGIRAEGYDCLFFFGRRIVGWEHFDLARHQTEPFARGDMLNFANNFIFLPQD